MYVLLLRLTTSVTCYWLLLIWSLPLVRRYLPLLLAITTGEGGYYEASVKKRGKEERISRLRIILENNLKANIRKSDGRLDFSPSVPSFESATVSGGELTHTRPPPTTLDVCTRPRRLAASRVGRGWPGVAGGWASRRQASLASCRRHIVRVRRERGVPVVCRCRRASTLVRCAEKKKKTGSPLLGRPADDGGRRSVPATRTPDNETEEPGRARSTGGETCETRGKIPTRGGMRVYIGEGSTGRAGARARQRAVQ